MSGSTSRRGRARGPRDTVGARLQQSWRSGLRTIGTPMEALRIERVIAVSRLFLTLIAFAAFNIGTIEPASYGRVANILLILFTAHSVSAMLVLRGHRRPTTTFALATHTVDLLAAAVTLPMAGPTNPFFTFFLFVLASAAFRWGLRETIATTLVAIALVFIYARLVATVPLIAGFGAPLNLRVMFVQAAYLAMMGVLLGYLAEAGRLLRAEGAIIVGLLGKIRIDAGLTRALSAIGREVLAIFNASAVVLVAEDIPNQRLFRWDTAGGWSVGPTTASDEPRSSERLRYQFADQEHTFAVARRPALRSRGFWYHIAAIDSIGRSIDAAWEIPDAFTAAHPFQRMVSAPIRFGDEWVGRLFVIDPRLDVRLLSQAQFLATLVRQVGPAVFSVYLLERLRTRAGAIERARVARELHDGVIQSLIGIEMQLEVLRGREALQAEPIAAEVARIQALMRQEVLNLRDLMQQMRPDEFDPAQLLDHLADMVQRFGRDTGKTAVFSTDLRDVELPRHVCFELVRIVQEGLVNVRKHSEATNVLVKFGVRDGFWTLEIRDDGRGFPFTGRLGPGELDAQHAGPSIIKERVRAIGGRLVVDSTPGRGACLEVLVPQGTRE
jgi:signal transduction histidine kinase